MIVASIPNEQRAAGLNTFIMRENMRANGFLVRMTEWHDGFQVCAFLKTNPHRYNYVSTWRPTEEAATEECYNAIEALLAKIETEVKP